MVLLAAPLVQKTYCTDYERIETYVGVCSLRFNGILEVQNKDRDC